MNQQPATGITPRERDVLETILHHVACHNGRHVVAFRGERQLIRTRGGQVIAADLSIDSVTFGPRRRGGA
jgi:hypothetical protein